MMSWLLSGMLIFFAVLPATTNYELNSYGFGSGGTAGSSTATYSLEGTAGEISGQTASTSLYSAKPGFIETQQANVPKIASFDNGSGAYYNKLHFVIDQQSNPSDALFALQISTTSNFSSGVNYVKSDLTIGPTLTLTDYQTYTAWGSGSGSNIIGLTANTTYYLRAKATQSKYTESGWGPSLSASTVNPSLSFSISPSSINAGSLLVNTVVDSTSNISVSFTTNATTGGDVYIFGSNSGLYSSKTGTTITSATADLTFASEGFGAKVTSASESSGGPFTTLSPYNGSGNNVGIIDTNIRKIFTSPALVTGGSGSILLKSKASFSIGADNNYTESLTLIGSANF